MALSNTATPIYYGQFRDAVMRGEIPINQYIEMEMHRIDNLIANRGVYYDDQAINGFIKFCENELTLTNGGDLHMLDSFKLWSEAALSWFYFIEKPIPVIDPDGKGSHEVYKQIKKRLITKQFLIIARGAAKSMYSACMQAYHLCIDTSSNSQIVVAPTMSQAEEVLSPIRIAINRSKGPFFKFMTLGSLQNTTGNKADRVKLASTKKGIQNFITGSIIEVKPMSINKLQGYRVKLATIDEWLSGDTREDVIGAIEQSCAKEQGNPEDPNDYLIIATSSEGTVRNGPGDTIKMELIDTLKGDYENIRTSIWYYRLDSIDEVAKPETWRKANPNIGITVTYETYIDDVEKAEKSPSNKNDILAKRFGIPMEGYTYYFPYEEIQLHPYRNYDGMTCALGADMSQGDDFCAFTFLFPMRGSKFGVKTRNYISSLTYNKLPIAARNKYDEFIKEGTLVVMEEPILDMMQVYDDLDQFIDEHQYTVNCFGYDPYNAKEFVDRWAQENGPFGIEKVIQGARTETVPLGELKKLSEERLLLFDEKVMNFAMGNCIVLEDTNGNRKLYKKRSDQKIDCFAALLDGFVAFKHNKDAFE